MVQGPCNATAPSEFTAAEEGSSLTSVKDGHPLLSGRAQGIPSATSYSCEAGFSAAAVMTSEHRAKINVQKEMRVAVSSLIPRFEKMCGDQQVHPSH
jgi:hypothetical protein